MLTTLILKHLLDNNISIMHLENNIRWYTKQTNIYNVTICKKRSLQFITFKSLMKRNRNFLTIVVLIVSDFICVGDDDSSFSKLTMCLLPDLKSDNFMFSWLINKQNFNKTFCLILCLDLDPRMRGWILVLFLCVWRVYLSRRTKTRLNVCLWKTKMSSLRRTRLICSTDQPERPPGWTTMTSWRKSESLCAPPPPLLDCFKTWLRVRHLVWRVKG